MSSTSEGRREEKSGFSVDVGEKDLFYVDLEGTSGYELIHSSPTSTLMKATSIVGEETVVRVSWSRYKRVAQGRGYKGMIRCKGLSYVPEMYSRDLHIVGSTYVEVSTRQYIEGSPLCDVWQYLSQDQKRNILFQMDDIVGDMSQLTSENFMELQGRNLSTPNPVQYLNYRIILSMITADLGKGDMKVLDMDEFEHIPVLCHGSLTMEHILVKGDKIVGVVGWSKCDYFSEALDRAAYHFAKPVWNGEAVWFDYLAKMDLFHPPPPSLYTMSCVYYCYYLRLRSTDEEYHDFLDRKLMEASSSLVQSIRDTYMGVDISRLPTQGDHGSLAEHSLSDHTEVNPFDTDFDAQSCTETIQTWENWEDNSTVISILDKLGAPQ